MKVVQARLRGYEAYTSWYSSYSRRDDEYQAKLWCGTHPAPHIVFGDLLCEGCYADHRSEAAPVAAQ